MKRERVCKVVLAQGKKEKEKQIKGIIPVCVLWKVQKDQEKPSISNLSFSVPKRS